MSASMRIAVVDDILERHVAASLVHALRARGHAVVATGKRSHGPSPTRDPGEQALLAGALRAVLRFDPDVVLLMRPQSWPVEFSTELRRRGIRIAAWLSDDPVLFDSGYGHVLEVVDLVLHCGGERVISHYDRLGLFAPGVNFPFWTNARTPRDPARVARHRGIFLGHLQGQVRSHRLDLLESLDPLPVIYGKLDGNSASGAWGGELRGAAEIERAAADAVLGLSMPQQFADYRGSDLDFPALAGLGGFETPSRVVQYAAMGLAILSLDPAGASASPSAFRAQLVARDADEFRARYQEIDDEAIHELANEARSEFDSHFTAQRRAAMLEAVLLDDSWRSASAAERAVLYRDFEALGRASGRRRRTAARRRPVKRRRGIREVALLGRGWTDPDSHLSAVRRSLLSAGFSVQDLNPYVLADRLVADPKGDFSELFRADGADPVWRADALVLVGTDIGLTPTMWAAVERSGMAVAVAYDDSGWRSAKRSRLSARADAATTVRGDVADHLERLGVPDRRRARLGTAVREGKLGAAAPVMALTSGDASFLGVPALELDASESAGAVALETIVVDPKLVATPSATMRMLRRLRRHGVALVLPVEVLAELDVELGSDDATYASNVELERKLRAAAHSLNAAAPTTSMARGMRSRTSIADVAALLAAID